MTPTAVRFSSVALACCFVLGAAPTARAEVPVGKKVYIKVSDQQMYLHANGGSNDGAAQTLHACPKHKDHPNCQWVLEPSSTRPGAYYVKVSDLPLYLHALGGSKDGARSTLHPCPKDRDHPNCQWLLEPSPSRRGAYYLRTSDAALYLHALGGSNLGAAETLHPCPKDANHPNCQWFLEETAPPASSPYEARETGFRVLVNGIKVNRTEAASGVDQVTVELYADEQVSPTVKTSAHEMRATKADQYWLRPASVYAERTVQVRVLNQSGLIGQALISATDDDNDFIRRKLTARGDYELVLSKLTRRNADPKYIGVQAARRLRVPTLDQKNTSACVAFSTVAALTTAYLETIDRGGTSEQELFDALALYERRLTPTFKTNREKEARDRNQPVDYEGWTIQAALEEITLRGIPFKDEPNKRLFLKGFYQILANGRENYSRKVGDAITTTERGTDFANGRDLMRMNLLGGMPLLVTYTVYDDFNSYASNYAIYGGRISNDSPTGGHAVVMTGFSTPPIRDNDYPYWMMQNSWGTKWGAKGKLIFAENAVGFDASAYRLGGFDILDTSAAPSPLPYRFELQTGTALHETDARFAFLVLPNRDLMAVKKSGTGSKSTEVHILSAASGYKQFSLQTGTALQETDARFAFAALPNGDLMVIKKSGTGSKSTEVHILSAASGYKQFSLQTGTALHETDARFAFAALPNGDLMAIKKSGTGSKSTEVHILTAASGYKQFRIQTGTAVQETDTSFEFAALPNGDLMAIDKTGRGTNSTEVHILTAASEYKQFRVHSGTALHPTDDTFAFGALEGDRLVAIKKSGTGSKSTEIHILKP